MNTDRKNKKPGPLLKIAIRAKCPVCGSTSYSRGGVHPQCEAKRLKRMGC